jgi:hypothetical protein
MTSTITRRPEEIWLEYLARLVWQKGTFDLSSWYAVRRGVSLGVPASIVIEEIAARIRAAGHYPRPGKLEQQWRRASMSVESEPRSPGPIAPIQRPAFDPAYATQIANRVPTSVDLAWIRSRSPISPGWVTPAQYLALVFRLADQILIFTDQQSQGQAVFQNWSTIRTAMLSRHLRSATSRVCFS